jgi:hypothetical protein
MRGRAIAVSPNKALQPMFLRCSQKTRLSLGVRPPATPEAEGAVGPSGVVDTPEDPRKKAQNSRLEAHFSVRKMRSF